MIGLLAAVAILQSFDGSYVDDVRTSASQQFSRQVLRVGMFSRPIQLCYDDCVTASLVEFRSHNGAIRYRLEMSQYTFDVRAKLPDIVGECRRMRDCATAARAQLLAASTVRDDAQ